MAGRLARQGVSTMNRRLETATELWCGACRMMHPKTAFGKDKNSANGIAHSCKTVVSQRNRSYHERNKSALNRGHAERRAQRKQSNDNVTWALKKLLSDAKRRARSKGFPFSVTLNDIHAPTTCPVFGFRLVYQADNKRIAESASIDRIDSSKGYIPGNVWVISWRANQIKSDASPDELRAVASAVEKAAGRTLDGRTWEEYPG